MQEKIAYLYKKTSVTTKSPGELILLLYEGAITFLKKAENVLRQGSLKKFEFIHNSIVSCQNILSELSVSLDTRYNGDVARNLFQLYEYMNYRLFKANIEKDVNAIIEVRELLSSLKSAWEEAVKREGKSKLNQENISQNSFKNIDARG